MYRMNRQMLIEDFVFPYGQLDKDNEWVKLADLVPWDEAEDAYARWNFWRRPESQWLSRGHSGPWMPRAEDLSAVSDERKRFALHPEIH